MREIKISDKEIRVRATAPALFFYKKEFKRDLIGDLTSLEKVSKDMSEFDSVTLLQITWAMAKADSLSSKSGEDFPSFENWIMTLEGVDVTDPDLFAALLEEARDGFFRRATKRT